mmetsp:Transcript_4381/g.10017  ORF Transcript_4381/g.10017 Transcript_4381/m.10017 type:complete len:204 (-) Transcript_4381:966-1577(-)
MGHVQAGSIRTGLLQHLVLHGALHSQDLHFIPEDLELFPHLGKLLGGLLDEREVFVPVVLDNLVHLEELLLLQADLLVFFLKVILLQLLHCNLVGRLAALAVRHRGLAGKLLSVGSQRLEVRRPVHLLLLELLELLLHVLHLLVDAVVLLFLLLLERLLLQVGAYEEVDLSLDVIEELLLPLQVLVLELCLLCQILLVRLQGA